MHYMYIFIIGNNETAHYINSDLLYIEVPFKAGMLYILLQDNLYRKQNWTISTCTRFRCQTRSRMAWSGLTPCTDIFGP